MYTDAPMGACRRSHKGVLATRGGVSRLRSDLMSNYLPATLGIVVILMASPALSNDVEGLQIPSLTLPANYIAKMPTGPFMSLHINGAEVLPPIPSEALLEMLIRD